MLYEHDASMIFSPNPVLVTIPMMIMIMIMTQNWNWKFYVVSMIGMSITMSTMIVFIMLLLSMLKTCADDSIPNRGCSVMFIIVFIDVDPLADSVAIACWGLQLGGVYYSVNK